MARFNSWWDFFAYSYCCKDIIQGLDLYLLYIALNSSLKSGALHFGGTSLHSTSCKMSVKCHCILLKTFSLPTLRLPAQPVSLLNLIIPLDNTVSTLRTGICSFPLPSSLSASFLIGIICGFLVQGYSCWNNLVVANTYLWKLWIFFSPFVFFYIQGLKILSTDLCKV